jgi:hypothetical protein
VAPTPSKTVRNERIKLLAAALNTLATTTVASATILPGIATVYGLPHPAGNWWPAISAVWLATGVGVHVLARIALGRLIE